MNPSAERGRAALSGYRQALAAPAYRRLFIAAVISRTGDTINFVALPLFVYGITASPAAVASTVLAEGVGLLLGGAVAQLVVDRTAPRRLMVSLDLGRAGAAFALAAVPAFPTALLMSFLLAVQTAVFSPASASVVPRLVPDRALPSANALQWTAGVVLQLIVAPLAGLLVVAASAQAAFALNALSFLVSALTLRGLPGLSGLGGREGGPWAQLPAALQAVGQVPILLPLLAMQALAAVAVGATSALLVVLARSAYGLSGKGYGLWLSAIGAGALVGPVLVPFLTRLPLHRVVSGAYVIRGAGDVGLGLLSQGAAGGLLLALYGMNTSSGMVSFQTLVQREVPSALRGRAFALLDVVWQSGRLLSVAAGGALAAVIGIRALFELGGALLILAGLAGWLRLRPGPPRQDNGR